MNNNQSLFNALATKIQKIWDTVFSVFEYHPTAVITEQTRNRYPHLQEQEIYRLAEEEVRQFYAHNYITHLPPI